MIEQRKSLDINTKGILDQSLINQIRNDQDYLDAKTVAIYIPMKHEVNLLDLVKDDKLFLIPRIDHDEMSFVSYDKDMKFNISKFGTSEPNNDIESYVKKIDYMIVPALCISKELHRIGYGKGYYDRYISKQRPKKIVGVIYPFQEIDTFDQELHDQKLDGYFKGEV